jgi:fimbrial isopeptide formation D2 family protein/LPXTG-motif cell wall-anchored protein
MKKLLSLIMACMLAISCLSFTAVYADEDISFDGSQTLTIHSQSDSKEYNLYQIFYGDLISGGILEDVQWGASIKTADYDLSSNIITQLKSEYLDDKETKNPLYSYFSNIDNTKLTADRVSQVLMDIGNESKEADAFARIVGHVIANAVEKGTKVESKVTSDVVSETGARYDYVFEDIHDGYYLVNETPMYAVGESVVYTKYLVKIAGPAVVNTKTTNVPQLDKKIVDDNNNTGDYKAVAIGDDVKFVLTSSVPNMSDYNKYHFVINDILSKGLDFTSIESVTVGNKTLTVIDATDSKHGLDKDTPYCTLTHTTKSNGRTDIDIVFNNFKQYTEGSVVTVNYTATVNENVVAGKNAVNYNKAHLLYSNDPNYNYEGEDGPSDDEPQGYTPWSNVYVYTAGIDVEKISSSGTRLTGAKFKIENAEGTKPISNIVVESCDYNAKSFYTIGGTLPSSYTPYFLLNDGSYTSTKPSGTASTYAKTAIKYKQSGDSYVEDINGNYVHSTSDNEYKQINKNTILTDSSLDLGYVCYQMVENKSYKKNVDKEDVDIEGEVGNNGVVSFDGLRAGTYKITELEAPSGYKLLTTPIYVKITYTAPTDTSTNACTWTFDIDADGDGTFEKKEDAKKTGVLELQVINEEASGLPSTGGIGLTLFYVFGSVAVVVAVVLLITKRRMRTTEK